METASSVKRVLRSFAFLDISGFTAFTDQEGDAASVNALADFRLVVRDVSSHSGVRVAKWLGDGAMFVGVETQPLISALLDIGNRLRANGFPLGLRAGITLGEVILFEGDDYIGTPVNLASRLCSEAGPGQIYVTRVVAESAPSGVTHTEIGAIDVRGFVEPVEIVALCTTSILA
jgi:adenylate cyclase